MIHDFSGAKSRQGEEASPFLYKAEEGGNGHPSPLLTALISSWSALRYPSGLSVLRAGSWVVNESHT